VKASVHEGGNSDEEGKPDEEGKLNLEQIPDLYTEPNKAILRKH
jgi:hypothetical protein